MLHLAFLNKVSFERASRVIIIRWTISHSCNTIAHANARQALVNCLCVAFAATHLPLAEEMG